MKNEPALEEVAIAQDASSLLLLLLLAPLIVWAMLRLIEAILAAAAK